LVADQHPSRGPVLAGDILDHQRLLTSCQTAAFIAVFLRCCCFLRHSGAPLFARTRNPDACTRLWISEFARRARARNDDSPYAAEINSPTLGHAHGAVAEQQMT